MDKQLGRPAFGSKAVSSCLVVTLTLLADYQRLDRRAQLSARSLNARYGSVKQHLWFRNSEIKPSSERVSDRFWKAEVFANGLEELITCKGF